MNRLMAEIRKGPVPGSKCSMQSYILAHSMLDRKKPLKALNSQQRRPYFQHAQYLTLEKWVQL